jgi:hypothetical protein
MLKAAMVVRQEIQQSGLLKSILNEVSIVPFLTSMI